MLWPPLVRELDTKNYQHEAPSSNNSSRSSPTIWHIVQFYKTSQLYYLLQNPSLEYMYSVNRDSELNNEIVFNMNIHHMQSSRLISGKCFDIKYFTLWWQKIVGNEFGNIFYDVFYRSFLQVLNMQHSDCKHDNKQNIYDGLPRISKPKRFFSFTGMI